MKFCGVACLNEVKPGLGSRIFTSRSQAFQDIYVQATSIGHELRHYLETGSAHPEQAGNTFALEKSGWTGLSVETNANLVSAFSKTRKGSVICADALTLDFTGWLNKFNFPPQIGYLQIYIDPAEIYLKCLRSIPSNRFCFAAINFEHDAYVSSNAVRNMSRDLLHKMG